MNGAVAEKMTTMGSAFGTGVILGWVVSTRPAWGTGLTVATALGGAVGALTLKGLLSEVSEGVAAAAMGALGSSLPALFGGGTERRQASAQKQLGAATNVVGNVIARQVKSAVEF